MDDDPTHPANAPSAARSLDARRVEDPFVDLRPRPRHRHEHYLLCWLEHDRAHNILIVSGARWEMVRIRRRDPRV